MQLLCVSFMSDSDSDVYRGRDDGLPEMRLNACEIGFFVQARMVQDIRRSHR